jgi:hypothetical protein
MRRACLLMTPRIRNLSMACIAVLEATSTQGAV